MLYLRTLGGVYVARDGGPPLGGAAAQRRLVGLLAILSASGDHGMSRDRLISLLWPDADPEKGRHSLTQATYHARRTFESDALFVPGTDVRLNPDEITSDVRELELALGTGDVTRAAELYAGAFLDDFNVPGNGEFERWADAQRRRLVARMERAFDTLATRVTTAGGLSGAVEWRRRQLALDPVNSRAALRLIEALAAAGDRVGALHQAHIHETLIRSELEIDADPAFVEAVTRIKRAATIVAAHVAPNPPPSATSHESRSGEADRGVEDGQPDTDPRRPTKVSRWRRRIVAASGAAAFVTLAVLGLRMRSESRATELPPKLDQRVVVAPFRVIGADSTLSFLREGLVELLSIRLGGDSTAVAVDPGVVLRAWRRTGLLDSTDIQRSDIVRLADRFGAASVVVGSVVGDARHLVITASLITVRDSAVQATTSADGPVDSLTSLVDHVAGRLLLASAGEGERFANRVTPSLDALRAYLAGQAAYRQGLFGAAVRHYESAVRLDTTFALAAMRLALAADRRNGAEQHDRALSLAWANRAELNERDRLHLIALAGPRYPEPSTEAEQLAAWEAAVSLSPDRTEVLLELGERFMQSGRLVGALEPERRAATLLRRVLELDPNDPGARRMLTLLAARSGDVRQLREFGNAYALRDSVGPLSPFIRWRVAHASGDSGALARTRASMPRMDDANLRGIGMLSQFDGVGIDDGERALRIRALRANRAAELLDAILARHSLAMNQGRPILALDLTEQLEEAQPGSRAHHRLRVLDALYGGGDTTAAERAVSALARFADAPPMFPVPAREVQLADACVIAQWRLSRGQLSSIQRTVADLRAAGVPRNPVPVGANPHTCAELLDAWLAVAKHGRAALARVARLDSLMLGGPAANDAGAYAHIVVARLYERIGAPSRALEAIRRRSYMGGWPRYLATALRDEGRLALQVGERVRGVAAYRAYLALRAATEGSVAVEVAEVRSAAEAAERQVP